MLRFNNWSRLCRLHQVSKFWEWLQCHSKKHQQYLHYGIWCDSSKGKEGLLVDLISAGGFYDTHHIKQAAEQTGKNCFRNRVREDWKILNRCSHALTRNILHHQGLTSGLRPGLLSQCSSPSLEHFMLSVPSPEYCCFVHLVEVSTQTNILPKVYNVQNHLDVFLCGDV